MLVATETRIKKLEEIPLGHAVLTGYGGELSLGICVRPPGNQYGDDARTVLLLNRAEIEGRLVPTLSEDPSERCMDLGTAIALWSGKPDALAANTGKKPTDSIGELIISNENVLVGGLVRYRNALVHWNLADGLPAAPSAYAVRIGRWRLGVEGHRGSFVELLKYPDDFTIPNNEAS